MILVVRSGEKIQLCILGVTVLRSFLHSFQKHVAPCLAGKKNADLNRQNVGLFNPLWVCSDPPQKINPGPLRKRTDTLFPSPTGLLGRSSTPWLKGEGNRLPNNLSTWWMAAQAKTTGDLALFCRLIGFPQCCLSWLSSLQPGTVHTFSQGGENPTSGLCHKT